MNMLKRSRVFYSLVMITALISPFFHATKARGSATVEETPPESSFFEAADRLAKLKEYLARFPDLTMVNTSAAIDIQKDFYTRDFLYLKRTIEEDTSRPNQKIILDLLDLLHSEIDTILTRKVDGAPSAMTFADYNFIAFLWAGILGSNVDTPQEESKANFKAGLEECRQEHLFFLNSFEIYKSKLEKHAILLNKKKKSTSLALRGSYAESYDEGFVFSFPAALLTTLSANLILSPGIFLPHVGPQDSIPIPVMNEGFGFEVSDRKHSAYFLHVPTEYRCSFRYLVDRTPDESWRQDFLNWERAGVTAMELDLLGRNKKLTHIVRLQKDINTLIPEKKAKAELAFFKAFLEGQRPYPTPGTFFIFLNEELKRLEETPLVTGDGFKSLNQYKTYIASAKHLKIPIPDSTLDSEDDRVREQSRCFLGILKEGYEILLGLNTHIIAERKRMAESGAGAGAGSA